MDITRKALGVRATEPDYIDEDGIVFGHYRTVETKAEVRKHKQKLLKKIPDLELKILSQKKQNSQLEKIYQIYADYYKYITPSHLCSACNRKKMGYKGLNILQCPHCGHFYKINPQGIPLIKMEGFDGVWKTEVIDIHKRNGNRPNFDEYIGRQIRHQTKHTADLKQYWEEPSKWYNPYSRREYGQDSIKMYSRYIRKKIEKYPEIYKIDELKGKLIGCWCRDRYEFCHGLVLLQILHKKYPNSFFINKWTLIIKKKHIEK